MARDEVRELIRKAQAAEVDGDKDAAVELLAQAARMHLQEGEPQRAARLYRNFLRLSPDRSDLRTALETLEAGGAGEDPLLLGGGRVIELPRRGPTAADDSLECWCSFCCRPKSEAGPMISGPAQAFICRSCLDAASGLIGIERKPAPSAPVQRPAESTGPQGGAQFVEAAVALSRALGWSLSEIRSLSADERSKALELVQPPKASRPRSKRR